MLVYSNDFSFDDKKKNPKVAKVSQIFVRIRIKGTVMINWLKLLDFLHREEKNFSNFQFLPSRSKECDSFSILED